MKYALLVSWTLGNGGLSGFKNIGDYIQSLAAAQFMPRIDEYFDKTGDDKGTDTIKMIMNGWYIWQPEKFPLSQRIVPLPVSMHISPICAEKLMSLPNVIAWFKKNSPIGCRDKETEKLLSSHGIDSYYSSCLTLTLGEKYKCNSEKKGLVFVDPYLASVRNELNSGDVLRSLAFGIRHAKTFFTVLGKIKHHYISGRLRFLKKAIYTLVFIKTYGSRFSLKELSEAEYISHMVKVGEKTLLQTEEEKLSYAENLVKKYASSKLVVTGRIHCALPCLGVETPVIFTVGHSLEEGSQLSGAGRFGGLIDFFHIARVKSLRVSWNFTLPLKNKDLYKPYAEKLVKQCTDFMLDGVKNNGGALV